MAFRKSHPWGSTKPPVGSVVDWGDPISSGLVGCWLFNEPGGNLVYDIARTNTGVMTNVVRKAGKYGQCLKFTGSEYITIPDHNSLDLVDLITIVTRIKFTTTSNTVIVEKSSNNTSYHLHVYPVTGGSGVQWGLLLDDTNGRVISTAKNDGNWHTVLGTFSNAKDVLKVYIDGILNNTNAVATRVPGSTSNALLIGSRSGSYGFVGEMDFLRLYNREMVPAEASRLFTEPFAGIVTPKRRIGRSAAAAGGASKPVLFHSHYLSQGMR